jgi:hypothetical protein
MSVISTNLCNCSPMCWKVVLRPIFNNPTMVGEGGRKGERERERERER